ncbi:sodium/proline symporter [Microbulbifer hydrolyticus]|uniref:Sodium/proline symporter n=1 Tax=Microbulbifer hydrolyticus TaxID=48074 RepID=A0A6P1TCC5_9GAMM|nr:sodium/proline symporter [Microbulbifer hydrolyticus]MBB5210184.1 sodium/proline symporter [Microbulbifer hydrolyticus]QHQ39303.1 sodium/proline symporter [Microbulbifer hydrolyticus]
MDTSVAIYTLVIYKLLLLLIGFWSQQRTRNTTDYFLGSRNLGPVVAAVSYGASSASAWTLLGMSGVTYVLGISAIWIAAGAIAGCAVAWLWIAPRLMQHTRTVDQITLTEFLAGDGKQQAAGSVTPIAQIASVIILVSFIFYIAAQFQGSATTFASVFDLPLAESLILGAAIITIYTFLGGFWAASITDTLQGILMLVAAILLPCTAFVHLGGWEAIIDSGVFAGSSWVPTGNNVGLAAVGFIVGNLAVGIGTLGQPHLLNRFMALRDDRALRTAQWLAIGWITLIFSCMFALGLMGRILVPDLADPESLFFQLSSQLLSPVLAAMLLAAVLSAIMSTADSMLLVVASTISHDLKLQRLLPGRELLLSRLSMTAVATLAVLVALYLPATIFERVLFAWIAIGSAFGPTVLARLGGLPLATRTVAHSIVTGFVLAVALYLLPNTPGDWAERLIPFCAASAVLLVPLALRRFSPKFRTVPTSDQTP